MPQMQYTPKTYNDPSALSAGWKPAFLLEIADEPTPAGWKMYDKSPRMYRWRFAVWEVATLIDRQAPERQSAVSSQAFTPKGRQPASKAYLWTVALLGRQVVPGETVDLDPMMPIPCRIKVERANEYLNILDVEPCPELAPYLTPEMRQKLAAFLATFGHGPEAVQPAPATPPPPPSAPQPGMQSWQGAAAQQPPAAPARPVTW